MTLHDLVERERRGLSRLTSTMVATAIVAALALAVAGGVFWLGGARWLELPRILPFLFWALVLGLGLLGFRRGREVVQRGSRLSDVALAVEQERSLRVGSLRGTLEVAHTGALGRLGAEKMVERLNALGAPVLAPLARKRALTRAALGSVLAVIGVFGMVSSASAAPDGWAALLHPVRAWNGTLLDGVSLDQVPKAVLRGERVTLTVRAPGRRTVQVAQRRTGGAWLRSTHVVSNGVSVVRLDPVDANVVLYATDGRATSDTATIGVVERPFIGGVTIHASFPAYLDRRDETIPLGEPARVPRGTVLDMEGQSSTELREVSLSREGESVKLTTNGRHFSGRVVASTSGHYTWAAVGAAGPIADVPSALDLDVQPDSAPSVEILSPGRDTTAAASDTLSLSILATDDHGVGAVLVRSWIVSARGETRSQVTRPIAAPAELQWSGETPLPVNGLVPGDALHVVAVASDRSPWKQLGESRELVIRLPTLSEQRDAVRASADSAIAQALATANAQKQLQQRTAEAAKARQAPKNNAMSFESAEQAKNLAKEQRQLADRMQQMQKAARQLEQQLKQTGALDSALQERLREAQKLMKDALTPELQEQLRKLEQASNKLSQDDARKAMQDLSEQQKKLREQLEKSVEMLKRAAIEGQMQTLKDEAKDMAKKQRELVDSMRKADTDQERSEAQRQAKDLADKAKDLSNDVKELQQRLKREQAEGGAERTAEANQKIQESAQQMEKAAREQSGEKKDGQQGDPKQGGEKQGDPKQGGEKQPGEKQGGEKQGNQGQAQQGGQPSDKSQQQGGKQGQGQGKGAEEAARQAAEAMEEAADQLTKAREQQVTEWKKELTGELDQSIQEMLQLAREQDQLEQQARKGAPTDELRSQQSALQQGVDKAGQRLQDAGKKSSLLSQRSLRMTTDARRKVEDATRQTQAAQTGQQMASAMREASEALNQAAASLVRDRERTQESNSATGFAEMLKQLQQMSQQQNALNSAVQDLFPKPGSQLDQQGQAQARQLAKQQREVAQQLDDAADRDDSGRAEQMAKEARQIAQALELAQVDPAVIERQQRLFRKMLDAGKLMEEDQREDTGKREAKAWTGSDVFTPPNASASGKAATRFQPPAWNELRGLTPEERRLVLEYFKKINAERP